MNLPRAADESESSLLERTSQPMAWIRRDTKEQREKRSRQKLHVTNIVSHPKGTERSAHFLSVRSSNHEQ